MKINKYLVIILIILFGCTNTNNPLKQKKENLLNGEYKAVCYSGYRAGQYPDRGNGAVNPTYNEILEDLNILTYQNNFNLIRLYDCGENSEMTLRVISENKLNVKVMLGIWLRAELSNHETCAWLTEPIPDSILYQNKFLNISEIKNGIELAKKYEDIVIAVNVGNEALVDWNDHKVDPETIITYVKMVKENINQQVTVADNYKWWADHGKNLAEVVDFVSVHTYPVWEDKSIDEGMSYTIENLMEVKTALPDSRIVITEAGWASEASEFGDRASEEIQERYVDEILNWAQEMNITTFIFEAFDESWKGDPNNPDGAEKHWGIFTEDRKPKKVMENEYSHLK